MPKKKVRFRNLAKAWATRRVTVRCAIYYQFRGTLLTLTAMTEKIGPLTQG